MELLYAERCVSSRRNPQARRFLPSSRLLRWRIDWSPRHGARGHRGIIARWVRAVVPHRWGDWHHLDIGCGDNPQRRRVKEYPPMEAVNVPKSVGCDKRMGVKAPTRETAMARASVKSVVSNGCRIRDSPDEEHQSHAEYADGLVHIWSPYHSERLHSCNECRSPLTRLTCTL